MRANKIWPTITTLVIMGATMTFYLNSFSTVLQYQPKLQSIDESKYEFDRSGQSTLYMEQYSSDSLSSIESTFPETKPPRHTNIQRNPNYVEIGKRILYKEPLPYTLYKYGNWSQDKSRPYQRWIKSDTDLPYNSVEVNQQQIERHKRVAEVCSKIDTDQSFPPMKYKGRSFFLKLDNLLYCPILKAGSTNIIRLLCWKKGPPCTDIKPLHPHNDVPQHLDGGGNDISQANTDEFKSYFSFAIVRNPWKRLVSVYIQKFIETRQGFAFCQVKQRFPRKINIAGWTLDFSEYLKKCVLGQYDEGIEKGYTVRRAINGQNGHWRPQHHVCSFCHLDYTFIGKIETMRQDEKVIVNEFGFKDIHKTLQAAEDQLLPNEKAKKTTNLYKTLWRSTSNETIERIRQLFYIDLLMFDYPQSPFL